VRIGHRKDPLRSALEDGEPTDLAPEFGNDLYACRARPDQSDPLVPQGDGVIPFRGVEHRPGKTLLAGNVRIARHPEHAGRGDKDVECLFAVVGRDPPPLVVVSGGYDLGAELDVRADGPFVGHLLEIGLDLRPRRQQVRPVRVGPKRVGVIPRWDIAG